MVKAGYALALRDQSTDYVAAEQAAEKAAAGMWQSEFQPPWVWLQEQFGGR
jgi:endonuclease YncB( thermonuclease family)